MKKKSRPKGRPSKYKEEYCDMLIDHMGKGLSYESFAGLLSICRDTLYEWESKHEVFSYSKKVGKEKSLLFWEQQGIDGLYATSIIETSTDGTKTATAVKMNTSAWIFIMKNRCGWRDNIEHSVSSMQSIKFEVVDAKN